MTRTRTHYLRFLYGWLWVCTYGVLHWCSNPLILEFQEKSVATEYSMDTNVTVRRVRMLPYLGWIPWDVNGDVGYAVMYFVQFIGGMSSAIGSITYDVFYISSLMIVCAQLRYLNYTLVDEGDVQTILRYAH